MFNIKRIHLRNKAKESNAGLSKDTSKIKLSQIIYELTLHQINALKMLLRKFQKATRYPKNIKR